MGAIVLKKIQERNGPGFGLGLKEFNVSLQELLDQINHFIEAGGLPRLWPETVKQCAGCHLCCHEPLPVTSIDLASICRAFQIDFIDAFKYLNLDVDGNVIDITLKRRNGDCIFLNKQGRCRIYNDRPFLCQTYICCHMHEGVEELRSQVVNQGMDELVRLAILRFKKEGKTLPVRQGNTKNVSLNDWPVNCFSGKSTYAEILLENVLSSDLKKVLLV
ncbi:MAG: YkgJ family cysteine cluster protein [Syntrophomonadaceae bacterium]